MHKIPSAWDHLPFFKEKLPAIEASIAQDQREILPPTHQRFAAFEFCAPAEVKVVILGQDPYPTPGHAHGLAFSAEPNVRPLPRSLNNIYKEMVDDLGATPLNADLRPWARQGILLLNTVLSVPAGDANGHKKLGWQILAQQALAEVSKRPCAFLLWGAQAHKMQDFIMPGEHFILKTAHPSPLSARRGFFGSKPFSRVNSWLIENGQTPINWA